MESGKIVPGSLYLYAPNKGAPVFFALAFGVSGSIHFWQCIRYKSFKVTALLPLSGMIFAAGYAMREYNAFHYDDLNIYLGSMILILIAPPILELANYHILGRILYYVPYHSPIHPGRTLTTFGFLSTAVEVLNGIGGSWSISRQSSLSHIGRALLKASLLLQVAVVVVYLVFTATFHYRCRAGHLRSRHIDRPCTTMYASAVLVLIRCVYRTVEAFAATTIETTADNISSVLRYEWFFYVFEAVPMLADCVLWNLCHPGRHLPQDYHLYLAKEGTTEIQGPGWEDDRPFLATLIDPFGLCGKRRSDKKPFWETDGH